MPISRGSAARGQQDALSRATASLPVGSGSAGIAARGGRLDAANSGTSMQTEADQSKRPAVKIIKDPWWLLVDPVLIAAAVAISALGTLLVYSATRGDVDEFSTADTSFLQRQALFVAVGLLLGAAAAFIEPSRVRQFWPSAYAIAISVLAAVSVVGIELNGTRGWFAVGSLTVQPSEPAKVVVIAGLALMLSPSRRGEVGVRQMAFALMTAALPVALVLAQPDLGTVLVYLVIAFAVIVVSGVDARWIACLALLAVVSIVGVFTSDLLAGYQQDRLTVFLFDANESSEAATTYAYNVEQAQIAIGNGGLLGQGLFNGTQTRSQLVPAQQTDFIFTVAGEELGLRGSVILLGLYALLLLRVWRTAVVASSAFDRLVCTGVFTMFSFQMFQAVGMTVGMMPVTGIPMPLVSYGGSSMLTSLTALGLVAGVYRRRLRMDAKTYF